MFDEMAINFVSYNPPDNEEDRIQLQEHVQDAKTWQNLIKKMT